MQRAKRLLEGLRIHHLGFGFFWTVTFIVLAGFQGAGAVADYWQIYILTEQTLMPLAVGALGALCAFRRCELPHWTASAASFMLSGAALLYFLAFHFGQSDGAIATVAGVLMGGSCALFFLLWEMFYVTEGQQRALICIPLSAAMSVALYLLIRLLPPVAVALAAVCVLPFLALLCLQKSLAEIEADATAPLTRPALRRAVGDLWRPALCVSILGFSWKLIAGIEQPTSGQILLDGEDITHLSITERARRGISFAFQQPVRFKGITVFDLISIASGKKLSTNEACTYLSEVGLCARDYVNREVNASLSGGELKRIEIATMLARGTKMSIFDEPEAGIDLWSFQNLISVFEKMHETIHGSILIISHQERILETADKIIVLVDGEVRTIGTKDEIMPVLMEASRVCSRLADKV